MIDYNIADPCRYSND